MLRSWSRCSEVLLSVVGAVVATHGAAAATIAEQPPANGCVAAGGTSVAATAIATSTEFPPLQVEISTPFEPTAVPSAGRSYVLYELCTCATSLRARSR